MKSVAQVPTVHGRQYLQQLCKHWSHKLQVDYLSDQGTVVFPRDLRGAIWKGDALVKMSAKADVLLCEIEAVQLDHIEQLKDVLAAHLDRFAFREAPLIFNWS